MSEIISADRRIMHAFENNNHLLSPWHDKDTHEGETVLEKY